MRADPVAFDANNPALPGAHFGDAFRMIVEGQNLTPLAAAKRAVYGAPDWVNRLLWLRNLLVRPFKLKRGGEPNPSSTTSIGIFPILESTSDRLVLGLDDRHLDFRLLVDVQDLEKGRQAITVSTLVKTHNLLGRSYLTLVMPFHKLIVPVMLKRTAHA
ncbi:MAG: DUF2867 domain-containing protein [Rhizobiaceae bacterium]